MRFIGGGVGGRWRWCAKRGKRERERETLIYFPRLLRKGRERGKVRMREEYER